MLCGEFVDVVGVRFVVSVVVVVVLDDVSLRL